MTFIKHRTFNHINNKLVLESEVITEILIDDWLEANVRPQRNALLIASDWTQLLDAPLTPQEVLDWALYRQKLRDITKVIDPIEITWPIKPIEPIKTIIL